MKMGEAAIGAFFVDRAQGLFVEFRNGQRISRIGLFANREKMHKEYDPPLDQGIARFVEVLNEAGIETFESCQGGEGHVAIEPMVRFYGDKSEGFKALDTALKCALPVHSLRRYWTIIDGEPVGPSWEMTFIFPSC